MAERPHRHPVEPARPDSVFAAHAWPVGLKTTAGRLLVTLLAPVVAAAVAGAPAASARSASTGAREIAVSWGGTTVVAPSPVSASARDAADASPPIPARGPGPVQLSNERTITRWAHVVGEARIYAQPDRRSPRLSRLHFLTEDGFPEVYLLLRAQWDAHGNQWVKLRVPMRPNGRVGWVLRDTLGPFHTTHKLLVVDRQRLRIHLFENGRRRWSAPVAVGKPSTPTPAGDFWIREWFKIRDRRSGYWPYALGTAAYSSLTGWPGGGMVGIHGPYYQPRQIPGRLSHGCIRLSTRDAAWLGRRVGIGTPLRIL